ncbi:MAG: DUF4926 domain-containing protein [Phycisphaerales bacterium]
MKPLNELDHAILVVDLPEHGLRAGDVGTVVLVHGKGEGYEIEFCAMDGETIGVVTVDANQVRSGAAREVPHVRRMAG